MRSSNLLRTATAAALGLAAALAPAAASAMHASTPSPWAASGSGGGLSWAIEGSVGAIGGKAYERVYDYPGGDKFKLSQLDWELKNIALVGVEGSVSIAERFQVNLGYWTAVSEGDGQMVDYDWMLLSADTDDEWTHRSIHPGTSLDSGSVFDVNLHVKAIDVGPVALSGIVGYLRDEWEWSARGGTYIYSDYENGGFRDQEGSFPAGKLAIGYRQTYTTPYLGVACDGDWGAFQLQAFLRYSPWVSAEDSDLHNLRTPPRTFDGSFSGGTFFGAGLQGTYFFTPSLFVSAALDVERFSEITGDVKIYDGGDYLGTAPDGGSVELGVAAVLLSAGYRF